MDSSDKFDNYLINKIDNSKTSTVRETHITPDRLTIITLTKSSHSSWKLIFYRWFVYSS
jgi:hypothetical protein